MGGDEGVEKRNGGDSSDLRQIFGGETFHCPHPDSRMLFKIKDELHPGEGNVGRSEKRRFWKSKQAFRVVSAPLKLQPPCVF